MTALFYARRPGLGIRPSYDAERLAAAEGALRRAIEAVPEGSNLAADARFFLAKLHLARNDRAGAARLLREVAAGQGHYASDAAALLQRLDR